MNKVIVELEFNDTTIEIVAEVMRAAQAGGAKLRITTGGMGAVLLGELQRMYGVTAEALKK